MIKPIKIRFVIVAHEDYDIWKIGMWMAFLNGFLKKNIYMQQPRGFALLERNQRYARGGQFTGSSRSLTVGINILCMGWSCVTLLIVKIKFCIYKKVTGVKLHSWFYIWEIITCSPTCLIFFVKKSHTIQFIWDSPIDLHFVIDWISTNNLSFYIFELCNLIQNLFIYISR